MKDDPKKQTKNIGTNFENLFEAISEAIEEITDRIEDGKSGTGAQQDGVFGSKNSPLRAQTGFRVRMGGLNATSDITRTPRPVNPNRARQQTAPPLPKTKEVTLLSVDVFENDGDWMLTADMPGIGTDDLTLSQDDAGMLTIQTTGRRHYQASVPLPEGVAVADLGVSLHNGILEIKTQKDSDT
ncbi:MAG: HSP20 family molecular chaperone IbpA [Paracoccaceae bacterium]|jgi:HSP20 family molecular chaperone IbpA